MDFISRCDPKEGKWIGVMSLVGIKKDYCLLLLLQQIISISSQFAGDIFYFIFF